MPALLQPAEPCEVADARLTADVMAGPGAALEEETA
jgi:hypothetical protein